MAEQEKNAKMTFEEVKFWVEEAKSCEERQRKEFLDKNNYPLLINYYEGEMFPDDAARQRINMRKLSFINEYFPNTNALIAEIMYQNPDIILEPTKPDAEENAPIMKSALMYGFKHLDALTENRLALFDMIMAGFCAVEVNHINIPDIAIQPRPGEPQDKSSGIIGKIGNLIKKAVGKEEVEEEVEKTLPPVEISYSTPDETYLRRWNPLHILFDWRADRLKDLRYIIKKIYMTHAEFNARYPDLKDKVYPGAPMPFALHEDPKHNKPVLLYEFQVKQKKGRFVNFILSPSFLLREIDYFERPYTTNSFNVKIGTLHEYGKIYPVSLAKINKAIQDDINNYATFLMESAERSIPKIAYDKNKVKADGVEGLRSAKVMDLVPVEGVPSVAIQPLMPTQVAKENKELLELFRQQKQKLWAVSESRLQQNSEAKFATDLQIQEAGYQQTQSDIQEGLRKLLVQEIDCLKDIIVQFWDDPMFFKITGSGKPSWYVPQIVQNPLTGKPMVTNSLADILTSDYECDIDISSAMRPNKERKKKELVDFVTWLVSPPVQMFLMQAGYRLDIEVIKKAAKEWGWNPDNILKELPPMPQGMPGAPNMPGVPGAPPVGAGAPPGGAIAPPNIAIPQGVPVGVPGG